MDSQYFDTLENELGFLTGIPADGGAPVRYARVEDAVNANKNERMNIYFHGNPVSPHFTGAKAREEDITEIRRLVFDIDPPNGWTKEKTMQHFDVNKHQRGSKYVATKCWFTGRLCSIAYDFAEPLQNTEENRTRIKELHRKMCVLLGADSGGDVAHLYKAPIVGAIAYMKDSKKALGWDDAKLGETYWSHGDTYTIEQLETWANGVVPSLATRGNAHGSNGAAWYGTLAPNSRLRAAQALLEALPAASTSYDEWLRVGMALESLEDDLFDAYDAWSATDEARYNEFETAKKWQSFKRSGVAFGSLVYLAKEKGWDRDAWVKAESEVVLADLKEEAKAQKDAHEEVFDCEEIVEAAAAIFSVMPESNKKTFGRKVRSITKIGKEGGIGLGELQSIADDLEQRVLSEAGVEEEDALTHDEIAREYINSVKDKGHDIVAVVGTTWVSDDDSIWVTNEDDVFGEIATDFSTEQRCARESDYSGIYKSVIRRTKKKEFFSDAPKGVAYRDQFVHVCDATNSVIVEPLKEQHRQTFKLDFAPVYNEPPQKLIGVLKEGMGEEMSEEHKDEQIELLRQTLGIALFGLMPSEEKALFIHGPAASGKSLLLNVMQSLVPANAVCFVPPSEMGDPKKVGPLAHSRLNIQYEAEDSKAISGKYFKQCVAGEAMQGWKLYEGTYTMQPTAATLMAGNHYPSTTDNSGGFWRRWIVVQFHKSKPEGERDKKLKDTIIAEESGQVLGWLIQGVQMYLFNGRQLPLGAAHQQGLNEWRQVRDSVAAFVAQCEFIAPRTKDEQPPILKTDMYREYKAWFAETERKQLLGRNEFYRVVHTEYAGFDGRWGDRRVFLGYTLVS